MINETGQSLLLDARESLSHSSDDNAESVLNAFCELSFRGNGLNLVDNEWEWVKCQISKISMIMSDSSRRLFQNRIGKLELFFYLLSNTTK